MIIGVVIFRYHETANYIIKASKRINFSMYPLKKLKCSKYTYDIVLALRANWLFLLWKGQW